MMRKIVVTLVAAIIGGAVAYAGSSNTNYTSAGTVGFRTTTDGTTNCVGATPCNLANVTIWDSVAGANGATIKPASTSAVATDPALVVAIHPSSIANVNPGTIQNWGLQAFGTSNGPPADMLSISGIFNTTPPTVATGNVGPLQIDTNANLKVNCITGCAASGASFGSAMPATGTAIGLATTSPSSGNMIAWAATTTYGTAPAAIAVPAVNAFVTNASTPVGPVTATQSPVMAGTQNSSAVITQNTAAAVQIVALSGTNKTYVTNWNVVAAGTANFTLVYGTGSNCATGQTVLTGAYPLTAQAGLVVGDGSAPVIIVPSGQALCGLSSAAVQISGSVAYQQF